MKVKCSTIVFHAILIASALMSGCGMLSGGSLGALGDLSKLIPGGAKLSLTENQNDLFMTTGEMKRATLPYEARPSNETQVGLDGGRLYGFIAPQDQ